MLILSRKVGERIVIGDGIVLAVVEVQGDRVKLGILAPRDVPVHREEVYTKIQKQKKLAST
jgi:carbon storage regulator